MKESEKIVLEVFDQLYNDAIGGHILQPIPVRRRKMTVKVD